MKIVSKLPPLVEIAYKQFCDADKEFAEAKKRKDKRKATILAILKKEQTNGYTVNGKKLIHAIEKKGSLTIDKARLKRAHKAIHDQFEKRGNPSVSLTVVRDERILKESE